MHFIFNVCVWLTAVLQLPYCSQSVNLDRIATDFWFHQNNAALWFATWHKETSVLLFDVRRLLVFVFDIRHKYGNTIQFKVARLIFFLQYYWPILFIIRYLFKLIERVSTFVLPVTNTMYICIHPTILFLYD